MDKHNPLLPFAFTRSYSNELALNSTPRPRVVIDENAQSIYHDRTTRPKLELIPNLKRRMGDSFNEKDNVKKRDIILAAETQGSQEYVSQKVSSFKNEDIMSFDHSEEPTVIYTSDDFQFDKELMLPSSPPVAINSDFDKFSVPQSPHIDLGSEGSRHQSPNKTYRSRFPTTDTETSLDSGPDFCIDKFNRFRPTGNDCPSTDRIDDDIDKLEYQKQTNLRARDIVISAFEEMQPHINLEGLDLTEVPHEIKDLNNLVVFDKSIIFQVYLTNNKIRFLNPSLFKFVKLNVLGLRQNKLEYIPASIKKLVNLGDLSIGINRLRYLPFQILNLPNLKTFRAGPNPFILPTDAIKIPEPSVNINNDRKLKFVSEIKYTKNYSPKIIPSLKTLCLAKISNYDVSYQETKEWKRSIPKTLHEVVTKGIAQGNYEETCSECDCLIVEPVAEVIEWWDILNNKNIPFKKEFCSGMCVQNYRRGLQKFIP